MQADVNMRNWCRRWLAVGLGLALLIASSGALAAPRLHVLVMGNNRAFDGKAGSPENEPLRYADDDAAAFFEFVEGVAQSAELLTVMDDETQRLYPRLAYRAQAPTKAAVQKAVGRIAARLSRDAAAGQRSAVVVFFSGHGAVDHDGAPALALFDGGLSHDFLYREMLDKLPADELHLLIDACHAEAVVRPRDAEAEVVSVSPTQANRFLVQNTLARYPQAGAIMAATTNAKAHEWDAIRHGVFTHELLSALRGAADINRDRRVEYSEVYAFMAAANRQVDDDRARLAIVAKPPDINRRAVLLELSRFPATRLAWLAKVPGQYGVVEIGDARGRRIVTLHTDEQFAADLLVPAGGTLYVRAGEREARFRPRDGEVVTFDRLAFVSPSSRARGALDDAFRRGLFAAPYGRRYYDGVVDQTPSLMPVDFAGGEDAGDGRYWSHSRPLTSRLKLVLGGGLSAGVASDTPLLQGLTLGVRPAQDHGPALSVDVLTAQDGPLREWRLQGDAGWLWSIAHGPISGWGGGVLSGGLLRQVVEMDDDLQSGFLALAPVLGISTEIGGSFGIWSEVALAAMFHRRDDDTTVDAVPSAWLGGSLRL